MRCVPLHAGHVAQAYALSSSAGWNQTLDDWRLLLQLGDACCGIEVDGQLVATATLMCYGQRLGWVGMVLTHPDFRRQGFARAVVSHLMRRADELGLRTVKLDATDYGRHLYAQQGFVAEQTVERWELAAGSTVALQPAPSGSPAYDLDAESCGYDRRALLLCLAKSGCTAIEGGYLLDRPGRLHRYLGPCVARLPDTARTLIGAAVARHPGAGWFWDLLPANSAATTLARQFGFEPVRTLTRMVRGEELRAGQDQIFAIGGFEFG